MQFYSTNNPAQRVSFKQAVIQGISPDGGLYMPLEIPRMDDYFFNEIESRSFQENSFLTAKNIIGHEIPDEDLMDIIEKAINFPAPLVYLDDRTAVLELFHGPTLAFKDFGARFMAKCMSYFLAKENKEVIILVATSGDTGSAVANGFYDVEGIRVVLLYPSQKVSEIQEKQLTTLDKNIIALEIEGTFDDCQRLVKEAFVDPELIAKLNLSSANSINIARLLPQSFYYMNAYAQIKDKEIPLVITVPSGNFGNLTAGLLAYKMGLPVLKFVAALNSNIVVLDYLSSGKFTPRPSVKTLSNAMDVGNPSNFSRILALFNNDYNEIKRILYAASFTDNETRCAINQVYKSYNYIMDPHGAVGFLGAEKYISETGVKANNIILETAHPGKFPDTVEDSIGLKIDIPEKLMNCMKKEKHSIKLPPDFKELKSFLFNYR